MSTLLRVVVAGTPSPSSEETLLPAFNVLLLEQHPGRREKENLLELHLCFRDPFCSPCYYFRHIKKKHSEISGLPSTLVCP